MGNTQWIYLDDLRGFQSLQSVNIPRFFIVPEPKAEVHFCDQALSVVRPSLTFRIFLFPSETTEQNSTKLDRRQDNKFPNKFVFLGWSGKQDSRPGTWLAEIFSTPLLKTAEWYSKKVDKTQDLNVFYPVCVFRDDRKNNIGTLASDCLRHFRRLLWKRWIEYNKTWQEARSQSPLPSLCFSGRPEKQDNRSDFWLTETFSNSPVTPLNRI